jgi:hypothetical protein
MPLLFGAALMVLVVPAVTLFWRIEAQTEVHRAEV